MKLESSGTEDISAIPEAMPASCPEQCDLCCCIPIVGTLLGT